MAALGQIVTVTTNPTLLFQIVDGITYAANGYDPTDNPTIFKSGTDNDPLPLLLVFPASTNIFLGGSNVSTSGAHQGANINGVPSMAYNAIGGDSLYAIVGSSTAVIQLLALRQ